MSERVGQQVGGKIHVRTLFFGLNDGRILCARGGLSQGHRDSVRKVMPFDYFKTWERCERAKQELLAQRLVGI